MVLNKEKKLTVGKIFLELFCQTLIFTHYTEELYKEKRK
jgi:hypothetical protein